jgi:hypothetical protein
VDGNSLTVIRPGSADAPSLPIDSPVAVVVAPSGTPNAGTVYVGTRDATVVEIAPGGTAKEASIVVPGGISALAVAPAGSPDDGTLYVAAVGANSFSGLGASNGGSAHGTDTVAIIAPGSRTVATVKVGSTPSGVAVAG